MMPTASQATISRQTRAWTPHPGRRLVTLSGSAEPPAMDGVMVRGRTAGIGHADQPAPQQDAVSSQRCRD